MYKYGKDDTVKDSERGPPSPILRNRLYNMDCMNLLPLIPDGSVSLILTDPPYGISYKNCYSHKKHPKLAGTTLVRGLIVCILRWHRQEFCLQQRR